MTSLELLKSGIRPERFYGEDDIPEEFNLVSDDDWTQDCKYQFNDCVYEKDGEFFQISNSRSGSYHTDWYYDTASVQQVKKVEKVVVSVSWEPI